MKKVKLKSKADNQSAEASSGRVAQRNRTRKLIVDTTMSLIEQGGTPSMAEIAETAEVSRRTLYMYFPTLEQLLIDATLGLLSNHTIDSVLTNPALENPVERMEQLSRAMSRHSTKTIHLGRALIRLTVEGNDPKAGGPRRGYRRVRWIEDALAPARQRLTSKEFERLVSVLTVLVGWEPMIALKDIRGLEEKEAADVLAFAGRAVVEKALKESQLRTSKQ